MSEWFIVANSNAAPFFSDTSEAFQEAATAKKAIEAFRETYRHPAGLYAVSAWPDSDAYHKGAPAQATWLSERAKKASEGTDGV